MTVTALADIADTRRSSTSRSSAKLERACSELAVRDAQLAENNRLLQVQSAEIMQLKALLQAVGAGIQGIQSEVETIGSTTGNA